MIFLFLFGTSGWGRTMQRSGFWRPLFYPLYIVYAESVLFQLVRPAGVEPATNGFEDRYSIHWAKGAYQNWDLRA